MIADYNSQTNALMQSGVVKIAVDRMDAVDLSECPADYLEAWDDLTDHWEQWHLALLNGDTNKAAQLSEESPAKADILFKIARREGYGPAAK